MTDLHDKVDAIVSHHPGDPEWEALILAAVSLAAAYVPYRDAWERFMEAKAAYVAKHPRVDA